MMTFLSCVGFLTLVILLIGLINFIIEIYVNYEMRKDMLYKQQEIIDIDRGRINDLYSRVHTLERKLGKGK